jgi:hypothetical protein
MMLRSLVVALIVGCPACVAPTDPDPTPSPPDLHASTNDGDGANGERTSEAREALTGNVCASVCADVASVGCGIIFSACAGRTAIALGAASIPCSIALPTACAHSAGRILECEAAICPYP